MLHFVEHTIVMRDGVLRPRSDVRGMKEGVKRETSGGIDWRNFQNAKPARALPRPTRLGPTCDQRNWTIQVANYSTVGSTVFSFGGSSTTN